MPLYPPATTTGYTPGGTDVAVADGGTGSSTASAARTALGLAIGTDVRAQGSGDPTSLAASVITVADAGSLLTASQVEAALQELALKGVGYNPHGSLGSTATFSALTGWHSATLNANCTFTLTAAPSSTASQLFLELLQDGTGGWAITLPASVTNKTALEAAQVTTLSTTSFLGLWSRDGGTTWYGAWVGAATGGSGDVATDTIWDAAGDLAVGSGANTAAKLTKGSDSTVLTISASTHVPVWAAPAGGANIAVDTLWDAAGDLVQGTGANTAAKLTAGTSGKVLTSNGAAAALTWETPSGGGSSLLAIVTYAPGSDTAIATCSSGTLADVDATNLIITFTAPASTNVLVRLSALMDETAADNVFWGLREGSTDLASGIVTGTTTTVRGSIDLYLAGISAGSHTYKWSFARSSGTHHIYGGPTFGKAMLQVWSAP